MSIVTPNLNMTLPAFTDRPDARLFTNALMEVDAAHGDINQFIDSLSAEQVAYLNTALPDIATVKQALDALEANKVNKETPTWITAELSSGWTHINASDGLRYCKNAVGVLFIRGVVYSPNDISAAPCCILPVGYRPPIQQWLITASSKGIVRIFRVAVTGEVRRLSGQTNVDSDEYILFQGCFPVS